MCCVHRLHPSPETLNWVTSPVAKLNCGLSVSCQVSVKSWWKFSTFDWIIHDDSVLWPDMSHFRNGRKGGVVSLSCDCTFMWFNNYSKTQRSMRIPNFCLPGHAGVELVNLPMSLSSLGLQQHGLQPRPWRHGGGATVSRWEEDKQSRGEGRDK